MPIATAPIEILIVEDNPADVRLALEALGETKLHNNVHVAYDGTEALEMLRQTRDHADAPLIDIVLLDLNLPGKRGLDVLREIKHDERLKHIPVVVLTTSQAERDVVESYQLNANAYVTKPVGLDDYFRALKSIETFWLERAKLSRA